MNSFYIVMRRHKRNGLSMLKKILNAMEKNNFAYCLEPWICKQYPLLVPRDMPIPSQCDAVVSAGGDGTFLSAAMTAVELDLPVLGINLGRIGFLTEAELHQADETFALIREGKYTIHDRMLLEATIAGSKVPALNDVVVNRGEYSKSIDLDVFVGSEPLGRYIADGYIVATPTGSTGYSLSAGGPVISPKLECIELTPICSHSLQNRTILVSSKETVSISMHEKHRYQVTVSCDGREPVLLSSNEKLEICASAKKLHYILLQDNLYFHRVRSKLNQL